ncbi:MAG: hypothetical protein JWM53_3991 [bacterium]|nr:hypothetical protein [bacterium]
MSRTAIVVAFVGVALVGCGSASPGDCNASTCMSGVNAGQMIKVCAHPNGTVTYEFGGSTCSCTISTSGGCPCGQQVLDWCGDSSLNDAGVTGGDDGGMATDGSVIGGGSDLAQMASCTYSLSGGMTATWKCAVSLGWSSTYNNWTFDLGNGVISGGGNYFGPTLTVPGAIQTGTFDHSQGMCDTSVDNGTSNGPLWREAYSTASMFGQLKLTITSLGAPVMMGTTTYYRNAHGSVAATLVNISKSVTAPDVQLNVTF